MFGKTLKLRVQEKLIIKALRLNAKQQKEQRRQPVSHYIDPDVQRSFDEYYFGGAFSELCIQLCEEQKNGTFKVPNLRMGDIDWSI